MQEETNVDQFEQVVRNKGGATPQIGKIYPFPKMAVTFEPGMQFLCLPGFRKFFITMKGVKIALLVLKLRQFY